MMNKKTLSSFFHYNSLSSQNCSRVHLRCVDLYDVVSLCIESLPYYCKAAGLDLVFNYIPVLYNIYCLATVLVCLSFYHAYVCTVTVRSAMAAHELVGQCSWTLYIVYPELYLDPKTLPRHSYNVSTRVLVLRTCSTMHSSFHYAF